MVLGGFRSFHVLVTTSLGIQKAKKLRPVRQISLTKLVIGEFHIEKYLKIF